MITVLLKPQFFSTPRIMFKNSRLRSINIVLMFVMCVGAFGFMPKSVAANSTAQTLPFSQNWSDKGLITTVNNWSGVPGIVGYLGDYDTAAGPTNVDPQTLLADYSALSVDVRANQTDVGLTGGGVTEFDIPNPVVALKANVTADAPFLLIHLDTTDLQDIQVSYNVRDIDSTVDNAIQQVALHYRVGNTGSFTNLPGGYIADATTGPSLATLVTPVSVTLPSDANNQSLVLLRIMTTNAIGADEWVGIDDISITGTTMPTAVGPQVSSTTPADEAVMIGLNSDIQVEFTELMNLASGWFEIDCSVSGLHTATVSDANPIFTLNPDGDFVNNEVCTVTIFGTKVTEYMQPGLPAHMEEDHIFSFSTLMIPMINQYFLPLIHK